MNKEDIVKHIKKLQYVTNLILKEMTKKQEGLKYTRAYVRYTLDWEGGEEYTITLTEVRPSDDDTFKEVSRQLQELGYTGFGVYGEW